jgi:pimeloyl-ACP methyl ester carboxylesterase
MKTKRISSYKGPADKQFVENWSNKIQTSNSSFYEKLKIESSIGETVVLSLNHERSDLEPIVILPGARTFGMFWDLNDSLKPLKKDYRIYLVDVIGQPGLSSGNSPDVKTNEFGLWICEVLDNLKLEKTNIVGASFGGLLGIKLANVAPGRITKMVLMNPIGFSYISLAPSSLFFNLLPIFRPNYKNVVRFVDKIVLGGGEDLSKERREFLIEIILQTLQKFNFQADYPYKMSNSELTGWSVPTYLIVGGKDALIPHQKTLQIAHQTVENLKGVHILKGIGHGIELSKTAIELLKEILKTETASSYLSVEKEKSL